MPNSWSKKKMASLFGEPHKQRPDLDNLIKSVNDALLKEDSVVYHFEACKYWALEDKIIIENQH